VQPFSVETGGALANGSNHGQRQQNLGRIFFVMKKKLRTCGKKASDSENGSLLSNFGSYCEVQPWNQLGTPGGAKSFLRGPKFLNYVQYF